VTASPSLRPTPSSVGNSYAAAGSSDGVLVSFLFITHFVGPRNRVWFSIAQVWWHLYCVRMYRRIVFCHLYPLLFLCSSL